MAQRRMFSLKIIDTDLFLDMPSTSQLLYFHLAMRADDDGFISAPKKILRMVGCSIDDFKLLVAKKLIIPFESGVCVIKHWRIHNYIQKDRYTPTFYRLEKSMLLDQNGIYKKCNNADTKCIQDVSKTDTQVRLGKSKSKSKSKSNSYATKVDSSNKLQLVIEKWNSLKLQQIKYIKNNRLKMLNARIKEYSVDDVLAAIGNIKQSNFLRGQNKRNWTITFDWLMRPNNFIKVLENTYIDKEDKYGRTKQNNEANTFYDFSQYTG